MPLTFFAVLIGAPFILLAVHAASSRIWAKSARQVVAAGSVVAGFIIVSCLSVGVFAGQGGHFDRIAAVYASVVEAAICYIYFHFFNMSETARRIRLLHEVYASGSLTRDDINEVYKTSDVIHLRLVRLVAMGQLKRADGQYCLHGRTLYFAARAVFAWRKMLRL